MSKDLIEQKLIKLGIAYKNLFSEFLDQYNNNKEFLISNIPLNAILCEKLLYESILLNVSGQELISHFIDGYFIKKDHILVFPNKNILEFLTDKNESFESNIDFLIELVISISNLKQQHYEFVKYCIMQSNNNGVVLFDGLNKVFNSFDSTPEYLLRKFGREIFAMTIGTSLISKANFRIFGGKSTNVHDPLRLILCGPIVCHLNTVRMLIESSTMSDLRKLKTDYAKMLILSNTRSNVASHSDIKKLFGDHAASRIGNIVDRKLKPALKDIKSNLSVLANYTPERVDGSPMIKIEIDYPTIDIK